MTLSLSPDELLSTTRAVRRRLDFDRPLDISLICECLELALQAPSGGNSQRWHFVVVTDPQKRQQLGEVYRKGWSVYCRDFHVEFPPEGKPHTQQTTPERIADSANYLAKNYHRAPVLVIPCFTGRVEQTAAHPGRLAGAYGSLLPAVWSFMLAARARGLGTCWTTVHLYYEKEAAEIVGIPYESFTQVAMIPVAHALGDAFYPGARKSLQDVVHFENW
jgi:nitroreductase